MICKRICALLFCICSAMLGYGQANVEYKFKSAELEKVETQTMYDAINKANTLIQSQPKLALDEIEKALTISYRYDNKRGEAYSYQSLAAINYKQNKFSESVNYYEKALKLFQKLKDSKAEYLVYKHLGPALESNNQLSDAAKNYRTFMELAVARNNLEDEILAKESLGRVLFNSKSYTESISYYQQLLVYYRSAKKTDLLPGTYENIGKCYAGLKDTAQALKYFNLSGSLSNNVQSEVQLRNSWENVSSSYNSVGKYDKGLEYEKKALKVSKDRGDKSRAIENNSRIANDYVFMNRGDEAIPYLEDNLNLASEIGEVKSTGEAYRALSDVYLQLGKVDDAKKSFEKYRILQENILKEKETELDARETKAVGSFEKEKQIELLVKDKELDEEKIVLLEKEKSLRAKAMTEQRRLTYVLIGVLALLIIGLLLLYRSVKQKQIANKLLSIRSLRSQMNPHFIFNSLNSVNSFISKSDERSANKYLTEFARLMRTVLEHSRADFVPLSDEISVLERYLSLEHIRFNEHFDFKLEIDEDLELEKLLIPPMLVQPYIENAIWHGLRYLEGKGFLNISFQGHEGHLEIVVQDNGIGRQRSKDLKTKNQKEGTSTGISNTETRLQLLNEVHSLHLAANISDLSEDGTGTRVVIEIPYIDVDDKRYAKI